MGLLRTVTRMPDGSARISLPRGWVDAVEMQRGRGRLSKVDIEVRDTELVVRPIVQGGEEDDATPSDS